jgi:hypothetical protein
VVLTCAVPREAWSDSPSPQHEAHQEQGENEVVIAIAGPDEERAAQTSALRELLLRLGLEVRASASREPPWSSEDRAPPGKGVRARVWIDARGADHVDIRVQVVRAGGFDAPVERLVPRGDANEIVVERVAHAVYATLESLLERTEEGTPPSRASAPSLEPPPSPANQDTSPRARPPGIGLDATAFASCRGIASGAGPVFGGGAAFDLVARNLALRPSLWLAAAVQETFDVQGPDVDLETNVSSFRALPGLELLRLPLLDLDFGAGIGLDLFHTIPRDARRGSVRLGDGRTLGDPLIEAQVLSRIRIAQGARLLVGVQLDYDFATHRYTSVDRFGNASEVLEPWALRPAVILGVCFPLGGAGACGSAE